MRLRPLLLCVAVAASACTTIDRATAHTLVTQRHALLLDVRSPEEFAAGHLEGAKNIPVGELPTRLDELGPRADPIVVYCHSGLRASRARKLLIAEGFTQVENLGAMGNW